MALAHAAGIALPLLGVEVPATLLLAAVLLPLVLLWRRPWPHGVVAVACAAGVLSGLSVVRAERSDCRLRLPLGWSGSVEGRFLTRPAAGSTFPFRVESGGPGDCREVVRALAPRSGELPRAGQRIRVEARWEGRRFPEPGRSEWVGLLFLGDGWEPAGLGARANPSGAVLRVRGAVQERIATLWGERTGPFVEALVLARREHLDPELRESFALSGTAHLLAISGFHVGVVAGLLLGLLRVVGLRPRAAGLGSTIGCWIYVLGIGAPHAAVRAALLLSLLVAARLRGRPVVGIGALSSALLILLMASPGWLASVGFQLSFAGTAGLLQVRGSVSRGLSEAWLRATGRPLPRGTDRGIEARVLRGGASGIAAGIAATLPTLPLLAWHFDRLSLLGIPATLAIAPVVSVAIPGVVVSLLLSAVLMPLGFFLAGGTGLLLEAVERAVLFMASLPGASFWVSRPSLVAASIGGAGAWLILRDRAAGRVRPAARRVVGVGWAAILVLVVPLIPTGRHLDLHVIDVGQGDALALEFPGGRWILVDAGPRSDGFDAGARRVVPYLKRWGAPELEAIVLTHPHLDHIGGAPAVIGSLNVRGILDPLRSYGSEEYLEIVEEAEREEIFWWPSREGRSFRVGDAKVTLLHPDPPQAGESDPSDPNDISVVMLVEWGEASILLTGDAPAEVERAIGPALPALSVLKLGHHGSRTATSTELLERTHPTVAIATVGEGNSFGHPHIEVTDRLEEAGIPLYRTDRDGDIRIRLGRDGSLQVRTSR